jgi:HEAT repeat protein
MKYEDLTYNEKLACISLFKEEAKKDEDWSIRLGAYRALGFTEEAKKDESWRIRLWAYRALGFTEEAKKDEDSDIRDQAKIYFRIKKKLITEKLIA